MATFRKRGPYQWAAEIRRKGYPRQHATFETKTEAMSWAADIESRMGKGIWRDLGDADKTTLAECIERYRSEVTPLKKGAPQEQSRLNVLARSSLADCYMTNIRSKDVADYRNHRLKEVANNTIRNEMNLLSGIFETCRKEWGMEALQNSVRDVSRPSPGKPRDRRLFPGEEERLLRAAKANRSPYIHPLIVLAIETAMRAGELAGLEWANVDLERRVGRLPDTKNGTVRDVPLSSRAATTLKSMPRRLDGKVFGYSTKPGIKSITHAFTSLCGQCTNPKGEPDPVENLHFHDLRHEATSRLFEKGLNPMQVAAITGHKTLQMLKRYTHLKAEDLAKLLG